jgi:hypothetical protein
LSERRIVNDGLVAVLATSLLLPLPLPLPLALRLRLRLPPLVEIRYLNVWGMAAWYWARRAKMVAVGPEGR